MRSLTPTVSIVDDVKVTDLFDRPDEVESALTLSRDDLREEIRRRLTPTDKEFLDTAKRLFNARLREIRFADGFEVKR